MEPNRQYDFHPLIIPCLTNAAYGIWNPLSLEWLGNYRINHDGIYCDIDNLNQQRRNGIDRLFCGDILDGLTAVVVDQGAPNYYHILANIIPDILGITRISNIDNLAIPDRSHILVQYLENLLFLRLCAKIQKTFQIIFHQVQFLMNL